MRAAAIVIVCALATTASASPGGDIPIDAFRPAVDSRGFVTVDGAAVLDAGQPSFGLITSYARGLLALDENGARYSVDDVVSPTLVAAVGVGARLEFGAALPTGVVSGGRDPGGAGVMRSALAEQGLGDLMLDGKLSIGTTGPIAWAAIATASLPTGARDAWLSAGRAALGARLVAEATLGPVRLGVNAGVRAPLGGDETFADPAMPTTTVGLGTALPVGAAIAWAAAPGKIELVGEGYALLPLHDQGYAPVEAIAGARFYLARASHLELGVGAGLGGGGGNPELRGFVGIVFEPLSPEHASGHMELVADETPPAPPPTPAAEPPVDDGLGDRDHDGIPDKDDLCPDEPEDYNGVEDTDGCPDSDFHHDTIADREDRCDRDACPDRDIVRVGTGGLIVLDDIQFGFDSAVIRPVSYHVLDAIADTLNANTQLTAIEIGGHTDERGADQYNLVLSQKRADAVMAYLVGKHVDAARLSAQGYGKRVPKVQGHDEHAWRINRRVEFVILERKD
jgi:outer membrane protein OmpA-like peptidoglycan-associated protein